MLRLYTNSPANMLRKATLPEKAFLNMAVARWHGLWEDESGAEELGGLTGETAACYYFSPAVLVPTTRGAAWKTGRSWAASSAGRVGVRDRKRERCQSERDKKEVWHAKAPFTLWLLPWTVESSRGAQGVNTGRDVSLSLSYCMRTFTLLTPSYPVSKGDYSVKLYSCC